MGKKSNLAIVFPGQGSQSLGMMDNLIKLDKDVKKIFNSDAPTNNDSAITNEPGKA